MNEINVYSILMDHFLIAVIAAAIYLFLRIIFVFINYLVTGSKIKKKVLSIFYFIQFIIWLTFIVIVLNSSVLKYLINNNVFLVTAGLILLLLIITAGKDVFAGIILRIDESLTQNSTIKTSIASGRIVKLGLRTVTLEPVNGEAIKLPYSQLASSSITIPKSESTFRDFETELSINRKNSPEETKQIITREILNSSYSSTKQSPNIIFLEEANDHYKFKLTVSVMNEDYFNRLLFGLKKKLAQ